MKRTLHGVSSCMSDTSSSNKLSPITGARHQAPPGGDRIGRRNVSEGRRLVVRRDWYGHNHEVVSLDLEPYGTIE